MIIIKILPMCLIFQIEMFKVIKRDYKKFLKNIKTKNFDDKKVVIEVDRDGVVTIIGSAFSADFDIRRELGGKLVDEWFCG